MDTLPDRPPETTEAIPGNDPFRPSEYTGLLMHALRLRAANYGKDAGLDMGVGSGVLLATLGSIGVRALYGVDVDPDAVRATERLLAELGMLERARLYCGSLWEPLGDTQFDVVTANLPHFAATEPSDPHHSRFWSMGGADGRKLLDPFLAGLRAHLRDNGVAFITHNVFCGMERTEAMLRAGGLAARPILSTTSILHPVKSAVLTPDVRASYDGTAIRRLGPYEFVDVQILEIRPTGSA
jgi:release factor glutamine methyltransferase